ncbi:hypothetical protein NSU_4765 [Novosphingobium pentaromativorans US6-1]|uniref:Uncharacterized protein n=1 Tax=Novosphingobium pentaromativorans US6-1 TaxID=1088721 RepID=G6EK94_9SPHN|nr:hypothetical protein NSU_4765 [Novosphingobium pentaromativorans US6-1]
MPACHDLLWSFVKRDVCSRAGLVVRATGTLASSQPGRR